MSSPVSVVDKVHLVYICPRCHVPGRNNNTNIAQRTSTATAVAAATKLCITPTNETLTVLLWKRKQPELNVVMYGNICEPQSLTLKKIRKRCYSFAVQIPHTLYVNETREICITKFDVSLYLAHSKYFKSLVLSTLTLSWSRELVQV